MFKVENKARKMRRLTITPERQKMIDIIIKAYGHNWKYATKAELKMWYKWAKEKLNED